MIPQFFELDSLKQEIKQVPHLHRLAFATAMCERLLPNYNAFSQDGKLGRSLYPQSSLG